MEAFAAILPQLAETGAVVALDSSSQQMIVGNGDEAYHALLPKCRMSVALKGTTAQFRSSLKYHGPNSSVSVAWFLHL
jgi:hypothetical protein